MIAYMGFVQTYAVNKHVSELHVLETEFSILEQKHCF